MIELNQEVLPKVLINRTYLASVSANAKKGEEKTYLSECLQTANWLTKSLDQRGANHIEGHQRNCTPARWIFAPRGFKVAPHDT